MSANGSFSANANTPKAPTLTLGTGVSDGATRDEATQGGGVVLVTGESGTTVVVTFTDKDGHTVTSSPISITAAGSSFPVTLSSADVGTNGSGGTLSDGNITVSAVATNQANVSSSNSVKPFTLDTTAPLLTGLRLTSNVSGNALKNGDVLTYTASYDSNVSGTPTAPTLTIGSETGIAMTAAATSGNTRSWTYTISNVGTSDSGAVSVVGGSFLSGITDAAGNAATGTPVPANGSFSANANTPKAPTLTLGAGVSDGATRDEATQGGGVVLVTGESGTTVVVTFTDKDGHTVTSSPISITAAGSSFPVTLASADVGTNGSGGTLSDGNITVSAVATNQANVSSSNSVKPFTLDTTAPLLTGLRLTSNVSGNALKNGDVLTYTASYDSNVSGTPTAPTLTIGSETGIAMTAAATSGNTRSWTYTISNVGTSDSGAVSVVGGSFLSGITDAAGNAATGTPVPANGSFSANANTPKAPTLTLGAGVSDGATRDEATQGGGVVLVTGESGTTVVVTFTDKDGHTVTSSPISITAAGSSFPVTLASADVGSNGSGGTLSDGNITVSAVATNQANVSSSNSVKPFTLDTTAPLLTGLRLTSNVSGNALKNGDVLTYTASYDSNVSGTPTAPTLTIGSETGIAMTAAATSGNTRSWTYTISNVGTSDSGAVSVVGGSFLSGITDAAGNAATGTPVPANGSFSANANTPKAPTLTLGAGVSDGATRDEATQGGGVVLVTGESGTTVVVTFTDKDGHTVTSSPISITAAGSSFPVTLASADVGTNGSGGTLSDGNITVSAVATNQANVSSSNSVKPFTLDTTAPLLTGLRLTSNVSGNALKNGDVLTYTATYDSNVSGTPTAPTLTIGSETGIPMTAASTSGSTRSWTYTISNVGTSDSGAVSVVGGSFLSGITDAAGNAATGAPVPNTGSFSADANSPKAPTLTLGSGVPGGATAAEATQSSGVLWLHAESGNTVVLTFSDSTSPTHTVSNTVTKTVTADGSTAQAVTLTASDIGNSGSLLHDGTINVSAVTTNAANVSSSATATGFNLDTKAPVLNSLVLSSNTGSSSLKLGDVLTYTATYDGEVLGTPTAPTLTIGTETGITLTPGITTGSTRSWSYTISKSKGGSDTSDSGAVSVVPGNYLADIKDAAGNTATGSPTPVNGSFSADANTPSAPTLTLGSGVSGGATAAEATQSSGVLWLHAESGNTVVLTFSDSTSPTHTVSNTVTKTVTADGSTAQAVTLTASDIGNSGSLLHDGTINVSAVTTNAANVSSSATATGFNLDTKAPVLNSLVLSSNTGSSSLKLGDVLTYTATYDGEVLGTPTAPTLTIGTETGITLTPGITTGSTRSWSYTISKSKGGSDTSDSGAVSVVPGNYLADIKDAAGNTATGSPTPVNGSFSADANTPSAPTLTLGSGVPGGATAAEATQSSGVLWLHAESGNTVVLTFSDSTSPTHTVSNTVTKTVTADGSTAQAVTLTASDIGNSGSLLHDGTINVSAVTTNAANVSSSATATGFNLDTKAPVLNSLVLSSNTGSSSLKLGDVLTYTATYDGEVLGTPTAPTLTIGTETGITLTPGITTGSTRSWSYTISKSKGGSDTSDSGAVSVVPGNYLADIKDAAGNTATGSPTPVNGSFSADANTPSAPTLTLGSGVPGGATAAEATQSSGVLWLHAESGNTVVLTFSDSTSPTHTVSNTVTKTVTADGSTAQAVTLTASDIGNSGSLLHDGTINVSAVTTNAANVSSSATATGFNLDTKAPVLNSLVLSSNTGSSSLKLGDVLTYTATYDGEVLGTPTAPTLTIGTETGITLTPGITTGSTRSWSYTISKSKGGSDTSDSGAVSVVPGNYLADIKDAAGNTATGSPTPVNGSFSADANTPSAPTLTLGSGVPGGATAAEATQSSGVLWLHAESGNTVVLTFSDSTSPTHTVSNTVTKTVTADGSTAQAVTLTASDIGNSGSLLHDGTINVSAVTTNAANVSSSATATGFNLDTKAPVLNSLVLSSNTGSSSLKLGDVLTYTATYDGEVLGTPTAPTLTIGTETGITLTPGITTGSTRSWSYTISKSKGGSDTSDSGAVSVVPGNYLADIKDAAGNTATGSPTPVNGSFSADANTPSAPTLTLGSGVPGGATAAEATQSSGVLWLHAESGNTVVLTFSDSTSPTHTVSNTVTKTVTADGSTAQAVTLTASDIGNSGSLLHDGTINVSAVTTNAANVSSSATATGFNLDTKAPVLNSLVLSSNTGSSSLKLGDVLTYTATYDGEVLGTPTAPTLTIGTETGITLTPGITTGSTRSWSYTISKSKGGSDTSDSGAVSVVPGNYLADIKDAAGNTATGSPTPVNGSFSADANTPSAPTLTLGSGVPGGATAAEATQSSGVLWLHAESGNTVVLTFSDSTSPTHTVSNTVTKTVTADGSTAQAVTLTASDIGNSGSLLHDGTINVSAVTTNAANVSSSATATGFNLDTKAPVLNSLVLSSNTGSSSLKLGDVLTYTATYDGEVLGTPTAPTLTIGTETGITLTPGITTGSTRSWSYTISKSKGGSDTSDSGAVSVVPGNYLADIKDAAGNTATGSPTPVNGSFSADANTPSAPTLTLGSGVPGGATAAEATQSSGVLWLHAESGNTVVLTFSDSTSPTHTVSNTVTKTVTADGSTAQAVTLTASDIGNSGSLLHDGTINVSAVTTNAANVSSSATATGFNLDTKAPVLNSLVLSSNTGSSSLKLGDVLTYTATYDGEVLGTPTAPTLTIGTETGITLTPGITTGSTRSWSYTISKSKGGSDTSDSGAVSVVPGNYLADIKDAAGNTATGSPTPVNGSFSADANTPSAPTLTLGSGVPGGATAAEATQSSGVLWLHAESGNTVVLTFSDSTSPTHTVSNTVTKTVTADGSTAQAVTLTASDIGNSGSLLHDGTINVSAVTTNAANVSSSATATGFNLDTKAPVLNSLVLSSNTGSSSLKLGDVLTYTATYDGEVLGTPTAPTLTIGTETGITLTPGITTGSTRSWSYTISKSKGGSDTSDSGAVSVVPGNYLADIKDAAGNTATGSPTPVNGSFSADANTPSAPTLTLGSGVPGGATAAEATQSSGVLWLHAESGNTVVLTFSDSTSPTHTVSNTVTKTVTADGSTAQAVTLTASDIGNSGSLLHDGTINVSAVTTNAANVSSSATATGFNLDTKAPVLNSLVLSSNTGSSSLKLGDVLTYTATYDGEVLGTPTAPTLTIGTETGITLTPGITTGSTRSWSYTISKSKGGSDTSDSGAVSVVPGNYLADIKDAAGNTATGSPTPVNGSFSADANTPSAPTLTLGSGVPGGATAAEATQSSGVLWLHAESGNTVVLTFSDSTSPTHTVSNTVTKTVTADGSTAQAVTLTASDIGNSGSLLHDGTINVSAVTTNAANVSSSATATGFNLDTKAPVLNSLVLSSNTGSSSLKLGDVLTYTATYDGEVLGTPTAPTLTIGTETGITLTPGITTGSTRSWSYTISKSKGGSDTSDSGAVSVVPGNYLADIKDAAGNTATGSPTPVNGSFSADANTPSAPTLTLGSGVPGGATAAEATQSSGVLWLHAESGNTVVLTFSDSTSPTHTVSNTVTKTVTADGSTAQAVTLTASDIGNSGSLLHDGTINVSAVTTNAANVSSSATATGFNLDTKAPVLNSLVLSSNTGSSSLKLGDVLTYTATYDGEVLGTPTAPTLTIGTETGITLTPGITTGSTRSWSYTISKSKGGSDTSDSGAVSVVPGNYLADIKDAAGNTATGSPTPVNGSFSADANTPSAPTLTLGSGVPGGATAAEATQSSGVLWLHAESGNTVVLTFSDSTSPTHTVSNTVTKTVTADGSTAQAVTLTASDIGNSGSLLHDGTINVSAVTTNAANVSSSATATGFNLDTKAPVLNSLVLSSNTGSSSLKLGDVLTYTATYDGEVLGTPTAPTLTIGTETGITLTPGITTGSTRSWSYTISKSKGGSDTSDSGAVSVVPGNYLADIKDAAGNTATGSPTPVNGSFSADANTPSAPTLTLGSGVPGGATAAEATQSSGVLWLHAESGNTVVLTFSDSTSPTHTVSNTVTKTVTADGSTAQAVTLTASDIGNSGSLLHDGTINVSAVTTNAANVSSSATATGFNLDTKAPVLNSLVLSSNTGSSSLKLGDVLTYTATYDGEVLGTPTAPTLTIGTETGITLTPGITTGSTRSWSYTISKSKGGSDTSDSGAVSVVPGNYLADIKDAAGNTATGSPTPVNGSFSADANTPSAPTLTLGSGVPGGATAAEATQSSGVLWLHAESGNTVVLTFSDSTSPTHTVSNTVTKTVTADGSTAQAVTLTASDIGNSGSLLHDGTINVSAVTTNAANVSSSATATGFNLDTKAPVLNSLVLSSNTGSSSLKLGDVLTYTATYDGEVLGTPTAPTLTIGTETGITLTPGITTGSTRSWSYTISKSKGGSDTSDSGAVSVVPGNYLADIKDAAGNTATGSPTPVNGSFSADANTPSAPTLTLGSGVPGGATAAEATQSSGVLWLHAESGNTVVLTFSDSTSPTHTVSNTVTKTVTADGSTAQAVTLTASDIGNSGSLLHDGTINVSAVTTNAANVSSSATATGFNLDTKAPVLNSLVLSSNTGSSSLKLGDVLTYTATYDGEVLGTPTAPTLTIGTETGITLTPGITTGSTRSWSYTISKSKGGSDTSDSGAVSVVPGNYLADIKDAAGNTATGSPTPVNGSFSADANTPSAPTLTLGSGVSGGATAAEATQSSGVLWLHAESGNTVVLTFSDSTSPTHTVSNTVTKTVTADGSTAQAVTLTASDIGNSGSLLHDGTINVSAVTTNAANVSSSATATGFNLDTKAPVLNSLVLSSNTGSSSLKLGDVLTYTATYDGEVLGTPTAPTLTIGTETGITLTPGITTGSTRSWSYTISKSKGGSDTSDSGAVSVVPGNYLADIKDAAGNTATGSPTPVNGSFSADANTPSAPTLTLGSGVPGGATAAEATQSSGVLWLHAESGNTVVLTFSDSTSPTHTVSNTVTKTVTADGSTAQAVTLTASDIGNSGSLLHDGTINVSAVTTNAANVSSSATATGFNLDTKAPVLNSLVLSSNTGSSSLKLGDVLTYTATYDGEVLGTPTAPTLTIGTETGITLTPGITTGSTRSWTYAISKSKGGSDTSDSGAVSVVRGDYLADIKDAAGNTATGTPTPNDASFTADANTPGIAHARRWALAYRAGLPKPRLRRPVGCCWLHG